MIAELQLCTWIGEGEKCTHYAMIGSSYCEKHHDRVYLKLLPEMADYIIDKEVKSTLGDAN